MSNGHQGGDSKARLHRRLCANCLVAAVLATAAAAEAQPSFAAPPIFDWLYRFDASPDPEVSPLPLPPPGFGMPADDPFFEELFSNLAAADLPIGILLPDATAPLTGWFWDTDGVEGSEALEVVLGYATSLDYIILDFESVAREANTSAVIDMVAKSESPDVRNARIGNYAYYPGHPDVTFIDPDDVPLGLLRSNFYINNPELNVAMPHAYGYATLRDHADPKIWGATVAPNVRSALFWAPLERVSLAKRNLPEGDELIPWVSGFLSQGLNVESPTREDMLLLMLHYRMRGIDGYVSFLTEGPLLHAQYRHLLSLAFHSMDCLFDGPDPPVLHNLQTDKLSGLQWSGVSFGDDTVFVISNLGEEMAAVSPTHGWPAGLPGVPAISPSVAPGEHMVLLYDTGAPNPCLVDCNGNLIPDAWDILVARSEDCDFDGVPDECQVCCPADVNEDGSVTVDDLLAILLEWGQQLSGSDVNLDGTVDVDDLITLIQSWGSCF